MNKNTDTRTALVDLELIIYKCAAKAEAEGTNLRDLVSMTNLSIREVVDGCQASNYYLVVSGTDNFRKRLYPETYKAGRPPKPPLYKDLYMEIQATYGAKRFKWHDQIEADDLLGIMLTNGRIENPILCSIDKDMLGSSRLALQLEQGRMANLCLTGRGGSPLACPTSNWRLNRWHQGHGRYWPRQS
jgi:hypothetical protein